jgi:hypothetical protein
MMNLNQKIKFYKTLNHPRLAEKIFNQIFEIPVNQRTNQYTLIYIDSKIKIKEVDSKNFDNNLGTINIKNKDFFTHLEIENQINKIINNIISSNIISKYDLQKEICELYNQEILNQIIPPTSKELEFKMINSFYEKIDLLITYSTIKNNNYLKEIK